MFFLSQMMCMVDGDYRFSTFNKYTDSLENTLVHCLTEI